MIALAAAHEGQLTLLRHESRFPYQGRPIVSEIGDKLSRLFLGDIAFFHQAPDDEVFNLSGISWSFGHNRNPLKANG
ncbi:hypothetical protein [Aminobacter aminovorans]|uniref:hypothetical protein n=1 Tax=Aminobacter aminovorans TaxID=83263 RepID=UPI00140548F4|nr:hypothetical protein [Aminobacter aminovorans]